jgi:hypothetical protein
MDLNNINPLVEHNFYYYKGRDFLSKNIEELIDITNIDYINVCPYEVNNEGQFPFIKFLLCKNHLFNKLDFLKMFIDFDTSITSEKIVELTKNKLHEILYCKDFKIYGFYVFENEVFLFVDLTNCKVILNDIYSDNDLWFVLPHEILNTRRICNLKIDAYVLHFFNENYNFAILENEKKEAYESPVIGYVGKPENKLHFTYHFGETRKNKNAILGPYYYFTDYKNAIKNAYELGEKNAGIVKFALFAGTTKYIENFPNDNIDYSETKKQRLEDEKLDKIYEQLTIRISDHDSLWTTEFDSCYLGNILLDNGSYLKDTPQVVLKEYNQQVPLSYHYIDKVAFEKYQEYLIV